MPSRTLEADKVMRGVAQEPPRALAGVILPHNFDPNRASAWMFQT